MMKIITKINEWDSTLPFVSFEYFPPKTEAGVQNLYLRMDRMTSVHPIFIDVTWGAAGSTKALTLSISEYAQKFFGVSVLLHITCTSISVDEMRNILNSAKEAGIKNILALRGDPPKGASQWTATSKGFRRAADLVRFIREEHGDYFCVAVAGYPEGHPQSLDPHMDVHYLKEKVDAGADFVLTQFFYEPSVFLSFLESCRAIGINCPIIPGMMPIQNFSSFTSMTTFCRTKVPEKIWNDILPIQGDDEAVKAYGIKLCSDMCKCLHEAGVKGFHFYTLNLESSVMSVLKQLGIAEQDALKKALPWKGSRSNLNGMAEDVRPINWANRPKSYVARTDAWDDFPNGRWGDGRSPAFGELSNSHFFRPSVGSKADRKAMWGESPLEPEEVYEIFAKYVEGSIPVLPWCETPVHSETNIISGRLANINRCGYMTINSQPAVNGERSEHAVFGWGGPGGNVYQKAYIEFFCSPENLVLLSEVFKKKSYLCYYAIDHSGNRAGSTNQHATALTWGVFPNKEILQPTIFDPSTFSVWSEEAFELWLTWACLYDDETDSSALLHEIHDTYFLVAVVDNNFHESDIYSIFDEAIADRKDSGRIQSTASSEALGLSL